MHHVLVTLNCAVWSSWVWAPLPTRSRARCTGVATTFTNNNAVWCWCFSRNSLFQSTALTQFETYTAERGSGLQFFRRSPLHPIFVFLFSTEEGKLLSLRTTQIWTLQMSDAAGLTFACKILQKMHRGETRLRVQMTRGSPCVTKRKEQFGLYAPPKPLLVNWIDLWKLFRDPQTIRAQ